MAWKASRWVWRLEAPLHVGMPPSGALNRCRLYVPARPLWGAVTAALARAADGGFPDYEEWGRCIRENLRFSYLYPAELAADRVEVWLPRYDERHGLCWDNDKSRPIPDRKFRSWLLHTRPGTAIEPKTDSALDGSLRETECLLPYWRRPGDTLRATHLAGYIFGKDERLLQNALDLQTLFLGGDTRYGLGRASQVMRCREEARQIFGCAVCLDDDEPSVESRTVWAHARVTDAQLPMSGAQELPGGWNFDALLEGTCLSWVPGSSTDAGAAGPDASRWSLLANGLWKQSS